MNKRTFFELNSFGVRYIFKEWKSMVAKSKGDPTKIMGSFNSCMDTTKKAVQTVLDSDVRDLKHLVTRCN